MINSFFVHLLKKIVGLCKTSFFAMHIKNLKRDLTLQPFKLSSLLVLSAGVTYFCLSLLYG
ncbi:MAG: hypothetical protein HYS98_04115 [Deltaproteobacteria bacterium]|nr:hypothetical protein [Deltaproteobacteria bacterium]